MRWVVEAWWMYIDDGNGVGEGLARAGGRTHADVAADGDAVRLADSHATSVVVRSAAG
jgi:hypothetical protein